MGKFSMRLFDSRRYHHINIMYNCIYYYTSGPQFPSNFLLLRNKTLHHFWLTCWLSYPTVFISGNIEKWRIWKKKVGKTFFFYIQTCCVCNSLLKQKTSLICQPRVMRGESLSASGADMLMAYMKWMTCNFWTLQRFLSSISIKLCSNNGFLMSGRPNKRVLSSSSYRLCKWHIFV